MPRQRGGALHEDYMNRFYELLHEARVRAPRLIGLWLNVLLDEDTPRIKRRFRGLDRYIEQMIVKYPEYSARALNNLVRKQRQMGLNAEHVVRARIRMVKAKLRSRAYRQAKKASLAGEVQWIVREEDARHLQNAGDA